MHGFRRRNGEHLHARAPWRAGHAALIRSAVLGVALAACGCVDGSLPLEYLDIGAIDAGACEETVFYSEVAEIFQASCSAVATCHGATSGIGLVLTPDVARERLVGQPSLLSGSTLVEPGDPEASFLMDKLLARDGATLMPPQGALPIEEIEAISCWIEQGAEP